MTEPPLVRRIPFARIVIILLVSMGISVLICGIALITGQPVYGSTSTTVEVVLMIACAAIFVLCAIGLIVTVIVWAIVSVIGKKPGN